jgi:hypothetical protein
MSACGSGDVSSIGIGVQSMDLYRYDEIKGQHR